MKMLLVGLSRIQADFGVDMDEEGGKSYLKMKFGVKRPKDSEDIKPFINCVFLCLFIIIIIIIIILFRSNISTSILPTSIIYIPSGTATDAP